MRLFCALLLTDITTMARTLPTATLQPLEPRLLLSGASVENGTLSATTGEGNDTVTVVVRPGKVSYKSGSDKTVTFKDVGATNIHLGDGSDKLTLKLKGVDGSARYNPDKKQVTAIIGGVEMRFNGAEKTIVIGDRSGTLRVKGSINTDRLKFDDGTTKIVSTGHKLITRGLKKIDTRFTTDGNDRADLLGSLGITDKLRVKDGSVTLTSNGQKLSIKNAKRIHAVADDAADRLNLKSLDSQNVQDATSTLTDLTGDGWRVTANEFDKIDADWWDDFLDDFLDGLDGLGDLF